MEALLPVAGRLAGTKIAALTLAASGGNSRIYRAETEGKSYALKYYAPSAPGTRNRLEAEVTALRFFEKHHVPHVPKAYGSEDRFALYDWMEGSVAAPITAHDIDKAADFLSHFPRISALPDAALLGPAAEPCLSLDEVLAQVTRRLAHLQEVAAGAPALQAFLTNALLPRLERYTAQAEAVWNAQGWEKTYTLPRSEQCLIPGDFGFHNILKTADGELAFIDFEYFGWDDPVKLLADTLLHPAYTLSTENRQRLHSRMVELFAASPAFAVRLQALIPLFSLRWALILCNEFLEEKRANRAFAANIAESDEAEWERRKQVQLAKAEAMLLHPYLALV